MIVPAKPLHEIGSREVRHRGLRDIRLGSCKMPDADRSGRAPPRDQPFDPVVLLAFPFGQRSANVGEIGDEPHPNPLLQGVHQSRGVRQRLAEPPHRVLLWRGIE